MRKKRKEGDSKSQNFVDVLYGSPSWLLAGLVTFAHRRKRKIMVLVAAGPLSIYSLCRGGAKDANGESGSGEENEREC